MSRPVRGLKELPPPASAAELRQLQKLADDLRALQAARDEKYNLLAASLAVQQERQARAQRIYQLKKQKEQLMLRLQELSAQQRERERQEEEASKQRAMVQASSAQAMERMRARTDALRAAQAQMQDMLQREQRASRQLEFLRWRLVGKLKTVFPLVRTAEPDVAYTIAGLSLPNTDFTGCDEEEIAAALGCVAHVLLILARWFDVPLRYTILFLGSRSVILDEIAHSSSPRFPLFSRGVDRARFEYGVYLLNKNLEQLLQSQGFLSLNLKQTLPNLAIFMNHQLRPAASVSSLPVTNSLNVLPGSFIASHVHAGASPPSLTGSLNRVPSSTPPMPTPMPLANAAGRQRRDSPSRRSAPQSLMTAYSPPRKSSRPLTGVSPSANGGAPP